jgi:hypothetical protein
MPAGEGGTCRAVVRPWPDEGGRASLPPDVSRVERVPEWNSLRKTTQEPFRNKESNPKLPDARAEQPKPGLRQRE